jgi:hypothetical protein
VLYIDVAKIDRGAAHVVLAIHVCFKCMFQVIYLFRMNVANVLSGCYESISKCCIYMHVASICFKCFQVFIRMFASVFILMLYTFAIIFNCFLDIFASVLDACFKCFIYLFLCCNCCWMFQK